MSEPKFTPGPWAYEMYPGTDFAKIYMFGMDFMPGNCGEANAALIAAAPDLYAALEAFLGWTQSPLEDSAEKLAAGLEQVTVYALAALAKARGEQ